MAHLLIFPKLWSYPKPVGIYPSSVSLDVFALTYKSHLGSYPFALTHGEEVACILEVLAIQAIGELALAVFYLHL